MFRSVHVAVGLGASIRVEVLMKLTAALLTLCVFLAACGGSSGGSL